MAGYLIDELHEAKQTPKACLLFLKGKSERVAILESSQTLFWCFPCFSPINGNRLILVDELYWKRDF